MSYAQEWLSCVRYSVRLLVNARNIEKLRNQLALKNSPQRFAHK